MIGLELSELAAQEDLIGLTDALSTAAVLMDRPAIDRALAQFPGARVEALLLL